MFESLKQFDDTKEHLQTLKLPIVNSENKIMGCFGKEVGPGVLQSNVQQTCTLQEFQTTTTQSRNSQWLMPCALGIYEVVMFIEHWIGPHQD